MASAATRAGGGTALLVPAAGQGRRLGGPAKQYRLLGDAPVLVQTLRVFAGLVDEIVVAVPEGEAAATAEMLAEARLGGAWQVVQGGATRQASVGAALAAVAASCSAVLVHDAVRPFVRRDQVLAVLGAVETYGAAALAVPVVDTVRRGHDGVFGEVVPREGLYRMQTPQGFRRDWFDAAHAHARASGHDETDDVALVQRLGHAVRIVPGSDANFKLTSPQDWDRALHTWAQRS